eukprot:10118445-Alexandrium_andersonii.AAC.1
MAAPAQRDYTCALTGRPLLGGGWNWDHPAGPPAWPFHLRGLCRSAARRAQPKAPLAHWNL